MAKMIDRPEERLRRHYLLERELADRIRRSTPAERKQMTQDAYRRLYAEIPWHVSRQKTAEQVRAECQYYTDHLNPFLFPAARVVELGCGTGHVANALAGVVQRVVGVDTALTVRLAEQRSNLQLIESDVAGFSLTERGFDLVFSTHLVEHLHPDDLAGHLRCTLDHLRPGGVTCIFTPHRVTGPHDVSRSFDDRATGFHLKEYTYRELAGALRAAGFRRPRVQVLPRRLFRHSSLVFRLGYQPAAVQYPLEAGLGVIPWKRARQLLGAMARLVNLIVYAEKP
jgi:SAM-dependent methyltransferase